jgi:CheY-like chemotaxis protein
VLDLMMPKLSGVEVLKFIRSQPDQQSTPVVIFTNSFMNELADAANGMGIQKAVSKSDCTPTMLVTIANELITVTPATAAAPAVLPASPSTTSGAEPADTYDTSVKVRQHFLDHAPETLSALRTLYQEFSQSPDPAEALQKLERLYRKAHFVASVAGLAECHRIALLASVFEALLFELQEKPAHIDPSVLHTIGRTVDFLEVLFDNARDKSAEQRITGRVLVVDDDPLSNFLVVAALRRARLEARAADNPLIGLELLRQNSYDLVLLDIEMPHMSGFDLCRKLRTLPGYARTPVIYVTAHSDFESRSIGVISGGNDLIAKPVFPLELAVKSVTHLIKKRLPTTAAGQ